MNNKIEFRGISRKTLEWEYGDLLQAENEVFICVHSFDKINGDRGDMIEVIPETVGQFICEKDKNDKKVFKGDKIKWYEDYPNCPNCPNGTRDNDNILSYGFCSECGSKITKEQNTAEGYVGFQGGCFGKVWDGFFQTFTPHQLKSCEVFGTIHDHLMKEGE